VITGKAFSPLCQRRKNLFFQLKNHDEETTTRGLTGGLSSFYPFPYSNLPSETPYLQGDSTGPVLSSKVLPLHVSIRNRENPSGFSVFIGKLELQLEIREGNIGLTRLAISKK